MVAEKYPPSSTTPSSWTLNQRIKLVATSVLVCLVAFWAISASFSLVLTKPVTHILADAFVNDELSVLSHEDLVQTADSVRAYALGERGAELPLGDDDRISFDQDMLDHLIDVRTVFQGVLLIAAVLTVLVPVACVLYSRTWGRRPLGRVLTAGGIVPVAVALLLGSVGAFNFDALFVGMHSLFFQDGTWTFPADSLLICALPIPFWIGAALTWVVALIVICVVIVIVGRILGRENLSRKRATCRPST